MQTQFIQANAANQINIDAEDFAAIVDHDALDSAQWPIWILTKQGQPVAWYCECSEIGYVAR